MKKLLKRSFAVLLTLTLTVGTAQLAFADNADTTGEGGKTTLNDVVDGGYAGSLDQLSSSFKSGFDENGNVDDSVYDYAKNQKLNTVSLDEDYPATFDLRHVGGDVSYNQETKKNDITGGTSYVTPVKLQNPWGTCWAFGICAASESSILYELGQGTTDTTDNENLNLSEHHLAWFAKNHIPAEGEEGYGVNGANNQEGEGVWYFSYPGSSSMESGMPFNGTSVFAAGMGVVTEEFSPYIGANAKIMVRRKSTADQEVYTEKLLNYDSIEDWEAETDEGIKENYFLFCYSDEDDWSIGEEYRFYQSFALEESNILPSAKAGLDFETGEYSLNTDGMNAVKSELMSGRAVTIAFYADTSDPNQEASTNTSRYINSNYAHYTWDKDAINHSVCIVGWDDDYDASNFGQEHPAKYDDQGKLMYRVIESGQELNRGEDGTYYFYEDEEGEIHKYDADSDEIEIAREADGSVSVPEGNGAWIVKNSWGSVNGEFPNYNNWGADGSGFFYLSYYDTSISYLETFDFVVTEDEESEYDYSIIDEYDYLVANSTSQSVANAPVLMANVFTAAEDMKIEAVSCETTTPGTTVEFKICILGDDEEYPTGDSEAQVVMEPICYTYGGYHRQALETPLTVLEGQRYAVVVMEYYTAVDDSGEEVTNFYICSNAAYSSTLAKAYGLNSYNVGVINPGESYILTTGYNSDQLITTDYYDYISNKMLLDNNAKLLQYDNFSIKAYAAPIDTEEHPDGLADEAAEDGNWYYYLNNKVATDVTTVAHNKYGWWYVCEGVVDFEYNGFASNENGDWYVENGQVTFKTDDIIEGQVEEESGWWYVVKSKVTYGTETVAHNKYGWWYIGKDGKVDFEMDTVAENSNGWWVIEKGKVNFNAEGVYHNQYGWWYAKNGKVDFKANTVAHNSNGWWYIKNGKVDFTYTGLGTNANGTWYCKNGKVDFSFNGTYNGKTIKNGKVVG